MEPTTTVYLQPAERITEDSETEYTSSMRRQFPSFGLLVLHINYLAM